MKILCIGRKKHGEKNDVIELSKRLQRVAVEQVDYAHFEDIYFWIEASETTSVWYEQAKKQIALESYDLVILLHWTVNRVYADIAHSIALYLAYKGVEIWNQEAIEARSMTKLSQLMQLALTGYNVAPTLFTLPSEKLIKVVERFGSWPLIYKDITASRGRHNYIVHDEQELRRQTSSSAGRPMILQRWLRNDKTDLRFFVAGGKVGLVIKRTGAEGSHLNNISAGGEAEIIPPETLPVQLIHEVETVARLFKRELCGIDYMFDLNAKKYVFLEINGTPQIINGVFADDKLVAMAAAISTKGEGKV